MDRRPLRCPYVSLLREGLASPPVTRLSRVGSYPTISTLPVPGRRSGPAIGGVISVALSLGFPRVAVNDLPALWSPDFPPAEPPESGPASDPPSASDAEILSQPDALCEGLEMTESIINIPN